MPQSAFQIDPAEFVHHAFMVKSKKEGHYMILGNIGLVKAARAAGCLLEPQPGDLVLAAVSTGSGAYITTVLERGAASEEARLGLPAKTVVEAEQELTLRAHELSAVGRESASLEAPACSVTTVVGQARFERFSMIGIQVKAKLAELKSVIGSIDTTADRMVQRLSRSYRRIRDFEDNRIGRWRCLVDELFSVRSKESSLTAEKQVKIDADKISLG